MQQQLDFLEGLEDTPAKGKGKGRKKGQPLKSGMSSDSDAYDASAHQGTGDDTDATTESMDVEQELPLVPVSPKKQPRNLSAPFSAVLPGTIPIHDDQKCGLCGYNHGPGACNMMGSSSNLMEFREMLMNHTDDEPWEDRVRFY